DEIIGKLEHSDVVLFLVSPDLIWSDFVREVEWPIAQRRAAEGSLAVIIPVILRPCLWRILHKQGLAKLQPLPDWERTIKDFCRDDNEDNGYLRVVEGITKRIQPLLGQRSTVDA